MLKSFEDMAANTETDTQTDTHCEILSPMALRAGGKKSINKKTQQEALLPDVSSHFTILVIIMILDLMSI